MAHVDSFSQWRARIPSATSIMAGRGLACPPYPTALNTYFGKNAYSHIKNFPLRQNKVTIYTEQLQYTRTCYPTPKFFLLITILSFFFFYSSILLLFLVCFFFQYHSDNIINQLQIAIQMANTEQHSSFLLTLRLVSMFPNFIVQKRYN